MKYRAQLTMNARVSANVVVDANDHTAAYAESFDRAAFLRAAEVAVVDFDPESATVTHVEMVVAPTTGFALVVAEANAAAGRIDLWRATSQREAQFLATGSWTATSGDDLTFEQGWQYLQQLLAKVQQGTLLAVALLASDGRECGYCGLPLPLTRLRALPPVATTAAVWPAPAVRTYGVRGYATPDDAAADRRVAPLTEGSASLTSEAQARLHAQAWLEQARLCTTVVVNPDGYEVARFTQERGGFTVLGYPGKGRAEVLVSWLPSLGAAKQAVARHLGDSGYPVLKVHDDRHWPRTIEVYVARTH